MSRAALSFPRRLAYGFATAGTGSFLVVPQLFLLYFMTNHLGISAAWASLTLLLPKLWEFLTDPYIGLRSDRTRGRWGPRHPFMFAGAVLLSLGIALVFNVPQFDSAPLRWVFVTSMFVLATTGYALFIVPYTALLAEIASDPLERTNLVALRMAFLGMSLVFSAVGWPYLLKLFGSTAHAYGMVGWAVGAVCLVAMTVTVFGTAALPRSVTAVDEMPMGDQLRIVWRERPFLMLALAYGLQLVAQSINSTMLSYVGRYLSPLGDTFLPIYFGTVTISSVIAMPLWAFLARKFSKVSCFIFGSVLSVSGYALSAVGVLDTQWVLLCGAILGGTGFAAGQVFGFSILPDIVDAYRARSGTNRDGAFTGVWVGWEKISLALGATFAGLLLGWFGFHSSAGSEIAQPASALTAMYWLFSIVPALLVALSVLPLLSSSLRQGVAPGAALDSCEAMRETVRGPGV